uniref:Uncharacterized protein n=1 Tax=Setaria digitata TaxID=48799 RepID=A0A915Q077_9BILA
MIYLPARTPGLSKASNGMLRFSSNTVDGVVSSVIKGVNGSSGLLDVVVQDCIVILVNVVAAISSIATSPSFDSTPNS